MFNRNSASQSTVWHSFARAISGSYEAGAVDRFRLAEACYITVET